MANGFPDEQRADQAVRRRLAIIQAHSELLLETVQTAQERDALADIHRSILELETLAFPSETDAISVPLDTVNRVLVCSQSDYLAQTLDSIPTQYAGLELRQAKSIRDAATVLTETTVDCLLVDAVWPSGTGLDVVRELAADFTVPPYALVSLVSTSKTPVRVALAGVVSPTVSAPRLEEIVTRYVDTREGGVAGLFSTTASGAIGDVIKGHSDTVVGDPDEVASRVAETEVSADAVCLDAPVYRALSPTAIIKLRSVTPGRGRPLLLVASTDADSTAREWIPTLGSHEFLHRPPSVSGLLESLLADPNTYD